MLESAILVLRCLLIKATGRNGNSFYTTTWDTALFDTNNKRNLQLLWAAETVVFELSRGSRADSTVIVHDKTGKVYSAATVEIVGQSLVLRGRIEAPEADRGVALLYVSYLPAEMVRTGQSRPQALREMWEASLMPEGSEIVSYMEPPRFEKFLRKAR